MPQWSRTEAFYGKPWLWCNVQNYGRHRVPRRIVGRQQQRPDRGAARSRPRRSRRPRFVNEGLGYNPVVYDLMFEMAWRDGPLDLNRWIADYAHHRYGRANADAKA